MKVIDFNTNSGIYIFSLEDFETTFHQHPVIEVIISLKGSFSIITGNKEYHNLTFGAIDANLKHRVVVADCEVRMYMFEHRNSVIKTVLNGQNLHAEDGIWFDDKPLKSDSFILDFEKQIQDLTTARSGYDKRIVDVIDYIDHHELDYHTMMGVLLKVAHLSESRLAHIFKQQIGLSIKKYLVWSKLKKTIKLYLNHPEDLFASLIENGFYDHPHFSNAFKTMLGIKPSKVYNSRILQGLPQSS